MIKLENVVLASPEQMGFIIEGMRNPMNSWEKSDSISCDECYRLEKDIDPKNPYRGDLCKRCKSENGFNLGDNDHSLMQCLSKAGTDHRKYMRMMPVYVRITAPLYWWKEFDTYKVGTVANSCSTMHKIQAKEFDISDFSCEHLIVASVNELSRTIEALNYCREGYFEKKNDPEWQKEIWWQMIQLLPSSYNQTRNVMINYEVLANIYKSRKNHKLDEWRELCKWIEELPYSELITGKNCTDDEE